MKNPYAVVSFREQRTQPWFAGASPWFTGSPGGLFASGTIFEWAVRVGPADLDSSYIGCDSLAAADRLASQLNVAYLDGSEDRARQVRNALGVEERWPPRR